MQHADVVASIESEWKAKLAAAEAEVGACALLSVMMLSVVTTLIVVICNIQACDKTTEMAQLEDQLKAQLSEMQSQLSTMTQENATLRQQALDQDNTEALQALEIELKVQL